MFMHVNCEHPRIILHPRFAELMCRYKHYFFLGQEYKRFRTFVHLDDVDKSPFWPRKNHITVSDLDSCYFVDDCSGECIPMYIQVPCGHCDVCKYSKVMSFVKRMEYEAESYDFLPWFVTLTYDDDHVPDDGLSKRDAQLFLKRFRRNLERDGFAFKFRYVLVGEYGKNTHRAHYHAVLYNIQCYTSQQYSCVVDLLRVSWKNGYVMSRIVDMKDDKCFFYTAKYLKKDCVVPDGKNPVFMLSSRGKGGIGSRFIDKIAPELRKTFNVEFKYKSKWKGTVQKLSFCRYLIDRVFPSFCRSVPARFRQAVIGAFQQWRYLRQNFPVLSDPRFDYDKLRDSFGRFFYISDECFSNFWLKRPLNLIQNSALCLYIYINDSVDKMLSKGLTILDCKVLSDMRERFLSRLFDFEHPIDLKTRAFKARKVLNYSSIYEVL